MKNKYLLSVGILGFSIVVAAFLVVDGVAAQTGATANVQYPVAELGNCANESACRAYCDDAAHLSACLTFGEKHNLMSQEEVQSAKKFAKAGGKGPGGCTGKEDCNRYCDDVSHIDECISFAEQNGMIPPKELAEARKVQAAIAKGIKPPACGGKQACDQYCSDAAHIEECITFGQAAGLMSEQEVQDSAKMLAAVKKGAKPPACRGKVECDTYCSEASHMEECMTFAAAAGFMSPQEAQDSQKMLAALKKGVKPPACKGKVECDKYCSEEGRAEECIAFAEAAGFMKPEEAAMARKTGGKGPGGCKGKEECEAFCNNPDNQETCFNFGRDNGMIPPGELQKMEKGKQQFTQTLNQAPTEVINCISGVVGADRLEKFRSGAAMPSRDIGDKIGGCFQQVMGPGGPGEGGMMPPAGQVGPGGCKTAEECQSFCAANPDACKNLAPGGSGGTGQFQPGPGAVNPGGQMMPQQAGPGGCKTPEECQSFCMSNPDACKSFMPPSGAPGQPGQGMVPPQPCEGENCRQLAPTTGPSGPPQRGIKGIQPGMPMQGQGSATCAPGTQCGPGAGVPGQPMGSGVFGELGMPGGQMQQFTPPMHPGMPEGGGGMPPSGGGMMPPSGSGPMPQQFQQQPQQFQQPAPTGQSGPLSSPPPEGGTPPPPPAGGSLFKTIRSFLGL